ncbi:MAG: hypothetical protein FK734_10950 [Asgard group archaeon]|nr:hypothetical protein [Asgard group archaeon]
MTAIDRYAIKYKDETKYFNNHIDAIVYVLSLPTSTEKIQIKKYGSWQKILIDLEGEINEIQRLVKTVASWEKKLTKD